MLEDFVVNLEEQWWTMFVLRSKLYLDLLLSPGTN
jgi:hypothetical protein